MVKDSILVVARLLCVLWLKYVVSFKQVLERNQEQWQQSVIFVSDYRTLLTQKSKRENSSLTLGF